MVRGGRVGEIKEIFSKVTGSSKGSLCKSHGFVFCLLFFFWGGGHCVLNIESIGGSQIRGPGGGR